MSYYSPMTRLQLRTIVRRELMEPVAKFWTDSELNQYAQDWLEEIQAEFEFVWGTATVTTAVSTVTLRTLTPEMHRLDAVYYLGTGTDTSGGYRLPGRLLQDIEIKHSDWRDASPDTPREVFQYDSTQLNIWPPLAATTKLILEYPVALEFVNDASVVPFPAWVQFSAKSYVCSKAYLRPGPTNDLKRALRYQARYLRAMERIRRIWDGYLPDRYRKLKPAGHYEGEILNPPTPSLAVSGVLSGVSYYSSEVPTGDIDGVNTTFTLSETPDQVRVFLNGLEMTSGVEFTWDSAVTITFTSPPQGGDDVVVWLWRTT